MSADELHYKSMSELSRLFHRREVLPSEVTQATPEPHRQARWKVSRLCRYPGRRAMAQAKKYDSEMATRHLARAASWRSDRTG
jgi:amidase